ncbi:hypothetical protein ACFFMP_02820 [Pseudoroseomonas cervicalis]|uniref:hypothetical protein n=1 Tax=Teichococcus cervicalis TaxID=204525 RepID=UPI0035E60439
MAVLLRLRALEVALAQRDLAERCAQSAAATGRAEDAAAAIPAEGRAADAAQDAAAGAGYAAWLPYGTAMRERRATEARLAEAAAEAAREALVAARTAERVVELAREARQEEAARKAARKLQATLDDMPNRSFF